MMVTQSVQEILDAMEKVKDVDFRPLGPPLDAEERRKRVLDLCERWKDAPYIGEDEFLKLEGR